MEDTHITHQQHSLKKFIFLSLAALGVVYGDIGTSPLYAVREMFMGHALRHYTHADVIGGISLVFWALTLIVTFKYVLFVLRADSDGEGGVFALYSLIHQLKKKVYIPLTLLIIFAAGLLLGDGIITPAISVLSAVEGLAVATPVFTPYIIPLTISILTALFLIQKHGTAKIGSIFGPIMLVWFGTLAIFGGMYIADNPAILAAVNPIHAIEFFTTHSIPTLLVVLGSVMLVVTGGEAMYADMGHFGSGPIRLSWLAIAYPALLLNYFGQGAYLLSGKPVIGGNLFFSMVPHALLYPMVLLATIATVIASQALISGVFSLTAQAISLGLFPYLRVRHTHREHEGQTYVRLVNWSLYGGAVALVLYFGTSSHLASAYGLAVSGVMLVTTVSMILIAREYWKWPAGFAYGIFVPLALFESIFLLANSLKFIEGGFIPVGIAFGIFLLIRTWQWGRQHVKRAFEQYPVMSVAELIEKKETSKTSIPRTIVLMTPEPIANVTDRVPTLKQMFWERYGLLPEHLIFLTVAIVKRPYARTDRYHVYQLFNDKEKGSITGVTVNFGFMEDPFVEKTLEGLAAHHEIPVDDHRDWGIHVMHERIRRGTLKHIGQKIRYRLFKIIHQNSATADQYFGLGKHHPLTIEVLPVVI